MPRIGETLRDARIRQGVDIGEVERATKIRAKYLRALENEEFDLLPGPTFVRSSPSSTRTRTRSPTTMSSLSLMRMGER